MGIFLFVFFDFSTKQCLNTKVKMFMLNSEDLVVGFVNAPFLLFALSLLLKPGHANHVRTILVYDIVNHLLYETVRNFGQFNSRAINRFFMRVHADSCGCLLISGVLFLNASLVGTAGIIKYHLR